MNSFCVGFLPSENEGRDQISHERSSVMTIFFIPVYVGGFVRGHRARHSQNGTEVNYNQSLIGQF